ncbi:DUF4286 family protein [Zhouia sp. PK063]|uniref:DUF4286 family protein n=1 Tax=Zhouia sp. PK063 TaxID=3373602 RepID=UPI0037AC25A2
MYIYNVTSNVDEAINEEWLTWMQTEHIPQMLATGKFSNARLTKVMVEEEMGGVTYSVQYVTDSKATLDEYFAQEAGLMQQAVVKKYGSRVVSFRTELELLSDH